MPAQYAQNWVPSRQNRRSHECVDIGVRIGVDVTVRTGVDAGGAVALVDDTMDCSGREVDAALLLSLGGEPITVTVVVVVVRAAGPGTAGRTAASGVGRYVRRTKRTERNAVENPQSRNKEGYLPAIVAR